MKQQHNVKQRTSEAKNAFPKYAHDQEISFENLYEDISQDWEYKAKRLQARRWRKIRHQQV